MYFSLDLSNMFSQFITQFSIPQTWHWLQILMTSKITKNKVIVM
jgi:hypothetical protein